MSHCSRGLTQLILWKEKKKKSFLFPPLIKPELPPLKFPSWQKGRKVSPLYFFAERNRDKTFFCSSYLPDFVVVQFCRRRGMGAKKIIGAIWSWSCHGLLAVYSREEGRKTHRALLKVQQNLVPNFSYSLLFSLSLLLSLSLSLSFYTLSFSVTSPLILLSCVFRFSFSSLFLLFCVIWKIAAFLPLSTFLRAREKKNFFPFSPLHKSPLKI